MSNNIYIWSNSSLWQQWNDIIDYVKIYKKPTVSLDQLKIVTWDNNLTLEKANATFDRVSVETNPGAIE